MTDGEAGGPEPMPGEPDRDSRGTRAGAPGSAPVREAVPPGAPLYRGEPLDAERGPGLGCFWSQVVVLALLLVLTPIGVANAWPIWLTGGMLVLTILLLLLAGQTVIFLLRLVAADRRTRRRPLRSATPTVGELDDRVENPGGGEARPGVRGEAEQPADDAPHDPGDDMPGRASSGVRQ